MFVKDEKAINAITNFHIGDQIYGGPYVVTFAW